MRDYAPKGHNLRIQRQWKVSRDRAHKGIKVGVGCDWRWARQLIVPLLRPRDKATQSRFFPGPEFSFDLLPEARAIRVNITPGPEVSVRLCHQWALECEELSSPFDTQVWSTIPCKKPDHSVLEQNWPTHCMCRETEVQRWKIILQGLQSEVPSIKTSLN